MAVKRLVVPLAAQDRNYFAAEVNYLCLVNLPGVSDYCFRKGMSSMIAFKH